MTDKDLATLAMPHHVLLRSEKNRKPEYVNLFESLLYQVMEKVEPTALEVLQARLMAAELWRYMRITEDKAVLKDLDEGSLGVHQMRKQAFKDSDERFRLRSMLLASLGQTSAMFTLLKKDVKEYRPTPEPPKQGGQRGR